MHGDQRFEEQKKPYGLLGLLLVSLLYCYRVATALLGGAWELLCLRRGAQSSS